jgi:2-hydroxychromene-2-carboxylate isomerase
LRPDIVLPEINLPEAGPGELPTLRFYCSFRSPYAYLAARRVFGLQRRYSVRVDARLIIPMKMAGFEIPRIKAEHFRFDARAKVCGMG